MGFSRVSDLLKVIVMGSESSSGPVVIFTEEDFASTYDKGVERLHDYRMFLDSKPSSNPTFRRLAQRPGFYSSWGTVKNWYNRSNIPHAYAGTDWCINADILTETESGTALTEDNLKFKILNELASYSTFSGVIGGNLGGHRLIGRKDALEIIGSKIDASGLKYKISYDEHVYDGEKRKVHMLKIDDETKGGSRIARIMHCMTGFKGATKENLDHLPSYLNVVDRNARRDYLRALYECKGDKLKRSSRMGSGLRISLPVLRDSETSSAFANKVKDFILTESDIEMFTSVYSNCGSAVCTKSESDGEAFLNYLTDDGRVELAKL